MKTGTLILSGALANLHHAHVWVLIEQPLTHPQFEKVDTLCGQQLDPWKAITDSYRIEYRLGRPDPLIAYLEYEGVAFHITVTFRDQLLT